MAKKLSKKALARQRSLAAKRGWETRRQAELERQRIAEARARRKRRAELKAARLLAEKKLAQKLARGKRKIQKEAESFDFGANAKPSKKPARGKKPAAPPPRGKKSAPVIPPPPESSGTLQERAKGKKAIAAQARKIAKLEAKLLAAEKFQKRSDAAFRGKITHQFRLTRVIALPNVHGKRKNDLVVLRAMINSEHNIWQKFSKLGEDLGLSSRAIRNEWFSPKLMFRTAPGSK